MNTDVALRIESLRVRRGRRMVLDGLTVSMPRGQVVGLLGPSGCGKTTLMRSIVGVQQIVGGTVTVLDLPAGTARLRKQVGYVTQLPSIYDDLSILGNLNYFRRILGAPKSDVDRVVQATDLADHATQVAGALSGGQRSRLSLAVALLGSPELLVLDEPTVGLDPVLRVQLWNMFHSLAAQGTSVLVSSHVMDEAARCQRLLLMRDGMLLADTTPAALPADTGTRDAEEAFLQLIGHPSHSAGQATVPPRSTKESA